MAGGQLTLLLPLLNRIDEWLCAGDVCVDECSQTTGMAASTGELKLPASVKPRPEMA